MSVAMMEPVKKTAGPASGDQKELWLGLPGMLAHKKFPERTSLMVPEVSMAFDISVSQVLTLIQEGLLGAIEITGKGNKTEREHWRVPVECYDDYIRRRSNSPDFSGWLANTIAGMRIDQLKATIARANAELRKRS